MSAILIGQAARLTGLSAKTIRYYEDIGLIPPPPRRNPSHASHGYRVYTEADVRRLALIRGAKLLDLSLAHIKQLVEAADEGCCDDVAGGLRTLLEEKLREIDGKVRELNEMRETVRGLLARSPTPSTRVRLPVLQPGGCGKAGCGPDPCR